MKPLRALVLGALLFWPLLASSPASAANMVVLLMDDAAASDAAGMPTLQQLAREGTTFDHAYTDSPMCAPSRAIIQSGQYSQNNGQTQNGFQQFVASGAINRTFAVGLHKAGVDTQLVGKYMNGVPPSVPGWDSFITHLASGDANSSVYYNYALRINGRKVAYGSAPSDYSTDVYGGFALQDIEAALAAHRRFFTMVNVGAPHYPVTPPPRYATGPGTVRHRTVLAVDDALKAVVGLLRRTGQYNNTYVVVTSDQGLAFGKHPTKGVPYEGSIRVPLIIEGPGVRAGVTRHQLVDLADLAPTFLDLQGAPAMGMDGRSLAPLLRGSGGNWRQALPITHEHMSSAPTVPSWQGVRTTRYAYFKFQGGGTEVYDMGVDAGQKHNIAGADAALTRRLARLSDQLASCSGAVCRRLEDQGVQ